jgi:hypothetical protein
MLHHAARVPCRLDTDAGDTSLGQVSRQLLRMGSIRSPFLSEYTDSNRFRYYKDGLGSSRNPSATSDQRDRFREGPNPSCDLLPDGQISWAIDRLLCPALLAKIF